MPYYPHQIAVRDYYPRSVIDDIFAREEPIEVIDGFTMSTAERGKHPVQKPIALMRFLIELFSRPGDLVLDSHMGSGSTGVAALESGRSFIGIEIHEPFFKTASNRLATVVEGCTWASGKPSSER